LDYLEESLLFYRATRYNLKGKEQLSSGRKYYAVDLGLRYYLLGTQGVDQGYLLENIVFLELLRRGHEVYVGQFTGGEIDFVAIRRGVVSYYQVAYTLKGCWEREISGLKKIKDHCPKYLLTLDNQPPANYEGINQLYVLNWLLN
jgi:predicted AAA+ superfamily ATPase